MPSVPTFTLTPSDSLGRIRVVVTNPGTNPDHNTISRNESGQPSIVIAANVAADGTFDDYSIPSEVTQFYSVKAVDSGGAFADSIIQSSSITLASLWLHAVQKGATSNLFGATYTMNGGEVQARPATRVEEVLISPARSKAIIATGEVINRQWAVTVLSPNFSLVTVRALEALQALRRTLCMRDGRGNILFGTIGQLSLAYDINSVVTFSLTETDFQQGVA